MNVCNISFNFTPPKAAMLSYVMPVVFSEKRTNYFSMTDLNASQE